MTADARRIVITGAGRGLGRALATGFAGDGYTVFGAARGADGLAGTAALCPPGQFVANMLDVGDAMAVAAWIDDIEARHGPIEALVCVATVEPRAYFLDQSAQDWDAAIRTNLCGVANACRAVLPHMLGRYRGRIVVIGSMADIRPAPGTSAYSVSKGALHVLVRAIASEIDRGHFPGVRIGEYLHPATIGGIDVKIAGAHHHYAPVKALIDGGALTRSGGSFLPQGEMYLDPSPRSVLRNLKRRFFA